MTKYASDRRSMVLHPYNIFLTLLLVGVTVLFLAFSVSYMYSCWSTGIRPVQLPWLFAVNTLLLLGSSFTIHQANHAYKTDNTEAYQRALLYTIILTIAFMLSQAFAWKLLFEQEINAPRNTVQYLYAISALHFMHVLAGLPFLGLFLHAAHKRMKEPVSVLIYFSDPEKRLKLRLLTIYWHYLDILWIFLVALFWLNALFSSATS